MKKLFGTILLWTMFFLFSCVNEKKDSSNERKEATIVDTSLKISNINNVFFDRSKHDSILHQLNLDINSKSVKMEDETDISTHSFYLINNNVVLEKYEDHELISTTDGRRYYLDKKEIYHHVIWEDQLYVPDYQEKLVELESDKIRLKLEFFYENEKLVGLYAKDLNNTTEQGAWVNLDSLKQFIDPFTYMPEKTPMFYKLHMNLSYFYAFLYPNKVKTIRTPRFNAIYSLEKIQLLLRKYGETITVLEVNGINAPTSCLDLSQATNLKVIIFNDTKLGCIESTPSLKNLKLLYTSNSFFKSLEKEQFPHLETFQHQNYH